MPKLPSEKLRSLACSKKEKVFKRILETDLYPFLDGLPAAQQKRLLNILNNTSNKNEGVDLIEFDTKSKSISAGLKALVMSVQSDWKLGWERQGEMMSDLISELCEWMSILWKVGVEMGVEHALVHESLKFCKSSYYELGNTNSRTEFIDVDSPYFQIEDATGRVVYLAEGITSTEHAILWVWRELLLSSVVHSTNDTLAKGFVADMKQLKLTEKILERLDNETLLDPNPLSDDENKDWELEEKRILLQNAHWTPEMRAAVPKVRALLA